MSFLINIGWVSVNIFLSKSRTCSWYNSNVFSLSPVSQYSFNKKFTKSTFHLLDAGMLCKDSKNNISLISTLSLTVSSLLVSTSKWPFQ